MEFLDDFATNVNNPVYNEGEKWIINYDESYKFQVEKKSGTIFGKKKYFRFILTNQRILMSNPKKNVFKMIPVRDILTEKTELVSFGRIKKKKKVSIMIKDKRGRFMNLMLKFGKKKYWNHVCETIRNLEKDNEKPSGNDEEETEGEGSGGPEVAAKPKMDIPWMFDLYPYSEIFKKDEQTAKKEAYHATPDAIDRNLRTLLGNSTNWCSNDSSEVIAFRNEMLKLKEINEKKLETLPFEKMPLPLFLSNEPEPKDCGKIFFLCGVHIDQCEQFSKPIFQSCQCDVKTDADNFLVTIIRKANNIRLKGTPEIQQEDWVLKVTGANEYIYGTHQLFKFEAIRRALKYGKPYIELNLLKKEVEMAKIDHEQGRLRHIEYFPEKVRENHPIDHQKLSFKENRGNLGTMTGMSIKDVRQPFKVTVRDFVCAGGAQSFMDLWVTVSKHGKVSRPSLDFDDAVIYFHARLVFGHFVLAEGFSRAKTVSNRTVFDEDIELWSTAPENTKKSFWPSRECHGSARRKLFPTAPPMGGPMMGGPVENPLDNEPNTPDSPVLLDIRRRTMKFMPGAVSEGEKFETKNMPRECVLLLTIFARKFDEKDPMYCPYERLDNNLGTVYDPMERWDIYKYGCGEVMKDDLPVGSFSLPMVKFDGQLETGRKAMVLNKEQVANLWSFGEGEGEFMMTIDLMDFCLPVYYPTEGVIVGEKEIQTLRDWEMACTFKHSKYDSSKLKQLVAEIKNLTPMDEISSKHKFMIWMGREDMRASHPEMLFPFLRSVPYQLPAAVVEAKRCLNEWAEMESPLDALELLDAKYADCDVRSYAVRKLESIPDHELRHYVLQLVQALKFELYHDNALTRFLLKRALGEEDIGQNLFWYLKSEMHIPSIRERFGLINEEFLKNCGGFRIELLKQACVVEQLLKMSKKIVELSKSGIKKNQLHEALRQMLSKAKFPPIKFKLPLSSKVDICEPVIEKCRVMGSAKKPLFLFFKNADPFSKDLYGIMFKVGDDLRQDMLTLQMLRIMDLLWKRNGLDFHIRPYGCITTGDMEGMIEIVQRSDTIGNIMVHEGTDLKKQLLPDRFVKWMEKHNPKSEYQEVRENFKKSCAGYCIASLALGLGDRHADNIMLSKNGDLFHIDFGHFLGHKKTFKMKKMGINLVNFDRETTPFVFTYQYAYVFENVRSARYLEFEDLCDRAFTLIRENAKLLMVLLMLMLGCGIPELTTEKEIEWIPNVLEWTKQLNPEQIRKKVKGLIMESVKNKRQIISDITHNLKHKGGGKSALANPLNLAQGLNYGKHIKTVL